ncbi:MAG: M24 family metallopeptidase [Chloroflexi bacterium]|nr:M24 family metallopeptidase [Chloroflexota bacterium]
MAIGEALAGAREYLDRSGVDGWLLEDYRGSNPILWNLIGNVAHVTRPCWFLVPAGSEPILLAHEVDAGRFAAMIEQAGNGGVEIRLRRFGSRSQMLAGLGDMLAGLSRVAMEYSPEAALPRVGRVDAGTVELVRSLGIEVVSSGDVLQYATERWTPQQRESHTVAMEGLVRTVHDAFRFIGENINWKLTEHDVAEFIRGRFERLGLVAPDGPIVAVDAHASDPHYEPSPESSAIVRKNSLVLIDLWAVAPEHGSVFGDITWTGFTGEPGPDHEKVFTAVAEARDAAVEFMRDAHSRGRELEGWEVDRTARDVIAKSGYADYFVHRLGHSIGVEVHSNAVNLDDWETHDTRKLIPGIAVSVEPGIYLPEFGIRSEIDVFLGENGPEVTGEVQQEIVNIQF